MNVEEYLLRICTESEQTDLLSLQLLQKNHIHHIPFENLDTSKNIWIDLNLETMYQKVITQKRGGLCFELNPLYNWLLNEIGFSPILITGTVAINEKNWGKKNTHLTNLVELEGTTYLTDVGFGNSSQTPIPLTGEVVYDGYHHYRIVHHSEDEFDLQKAEYEEWQTQVRFSTEARTLADYEPLSSFVQSDPNSPFTNGVVVTIATNEGRTTLTKDSLSFTKNAQKTVFDVNEDEWDYLYNLYFR
ncbi:arylamine N-acetyltransferase [Anaerobacillus sp. 1_MG-2023]|uniref:arylamine N-acetyltransferase family protein n=1 Tax=Bacillales TaxID=1385 RepID=UPI0026E203FB|nr:arylamine N-acetyltransferase [Anaerobacillus sp. 1_MG-2023]MDO6658320.1 arylamine N-acetyltransferase [Anaerobacillus sp. 1_MG-2023]